MHKKITRLMFWCCFMLLALRASAQEWQWQMGMGKGLNKALIQQHGIANAEVASIGASMPLAWAQAFSWADVDHTFFTVHYAHLWGEYAQHHEQLSISAAALIFRWDQTSSVMGFVEAGVGVSHLSEAVFEGIETYGQNNFALDFALGDTLPWSANWEWSVRYRHYSNGYTHRPNPGLDYAVLLLAYRFQ